MRREMTSKLTVVCLDLESAQCVGEILFSSHYTGSYPDLVSVDWLEILLVCMWEPQ